MEIHTTLIDSRNKRWFAKVAKAAERVVNDLIKPINDNQQLEIHAHFDTSESSRVEIVDYLKGKMSCTQVVFAAKEWQTVSDSIPHATAQLASATIALAPVTVRSQLMNLFARDLALTPVHRSNRDVPSDDLTDFYLYVEEPMGIDEHFALIDRIDGELAKRDAGQVSGNAYGLNGVGSCIDLVTVNRKKAQDIVDKQIHEFGIRRYRFEP